jgi:hypothetical protein
MASSTIGNCSDALSAPFFSFFCKSSTSLAKALYF